MDKRWGQRRTIALDVLIYHRGVPVLRTRTRDLGVQGLFARTGPPGLRAGTPVEVELVVPHAERTDRLRLPATVAYATSEGVGLRFEVFDPALFGELLRLRDAAAVG